MKTILLLMALALGAYAQDIQATTADGRKVILKPNGTWKYVTESATAGAASLSVEAGLIFKSGDVKPLARAKFYLLDDDLGNILLQAGLRDPNPIGNSTKSPKDQLVTAYAFAFRYASLPEYAEFFPKAMKEIEKHTIASVSTDFGGKAAFDTVPAKTYFLVGASEAGRSFVLWNLKVELKAGKNSITLDNNNTAVAF